MLVGAMNFGLHFVAWRSGRLGAYWRDPECAAFLRLMLGLSMVTLVYLLVAGRLRGHPAARGGRRVPGRVHRDDHGLHDLALPPLAGRAPGAAALRLVHRRLRGFDGGRAQGGALPAAREAGATRSHPARAPHGGDPGAARRSRGAAARGGRRVGLLRRLRGCVHRADAGADGHRARPGRRPSRPSARRSTTSVPGSARWRATTRR